MNSPKFHAISLWLIGGLLGAIAVYNVIFIEEVKTNGLERNIELPAISLIFFLTGLGIWKLKKWAVIALIVLFVGTLFVLIQESRLSKNLFLIFVVCFYGPLSVNAIVRLWNLVGE